ncbi:MAG: MBL fold metallo-hydrolase [Gammaproteobacteria bacterium]|nr:MBL fold metallo-hydrolase [Gammaproteobacteria bacterium]
MAASAAPPVETPYGAVSLPFTLYQVPGAPVYYVEGLSGVPDSVNEGHTSNAGFVVTEAGVVVFDALGTPALGYRLLQRIREVTDKPVKCVVVSHYHADHIYGLQAFKEHANAPTVLAQRGTLGYTGGTADSQGEDAARRLEQRRQALFPWVDEKTTIVAPDQVFDRETSFELGGVRFEVKHLGPAHAPGDAIMLVRNYGVLFGGDVIYGGRVPFLDSPETDITQWLAGLDYIAGLKDQVQYVIPGHGTMSEDAQRVVEATRNYILYVREVMARAVGDLVPFDEAYLNTGWSRFEKLPAFDASNRGNAYRIYLDEEARSLR